MKNIIVIYPHDPTTSFLLEPFQYLQKVTKSVTFYEVHPNDQSHYKCKLLIRKFEIIIFMGHGSHQKLSGSRDDSYSFDSLISANEMGELNDKSWILFSCNSNELLRKCSSVIHYSIGFGDLPTDFNDIRGIREFEAGAYLNVTENTISDFQKSINWIISLSILYLVENRVNVKELFHFIKILITKRMIDILNDPFNTTQKEHAKLLFDMKRDSILINNSGIL